VVGVQLEGAQLLSQRFRVRVRVDNPNDRELPVQSITFVLDVDGDRVGDGATAAPFTIPARGSGSFEAIVTTDLATTLGKLLPKLRDGAPPVEYHIAGVVNTELAFLRTIPFDQRGSYSLSLRAP
jgi:LEA14-like dessication related protein